MLFHVLIKKTLGSFFMVISAEQMSIFLSNTIKFHPTKAVLRYGGKLHRLLETASI